MINLRRSVLFLCLIALFLSCGRRSNPKPPEERAPLPVIDAQIISQKDSLILTWRAPQKTASGDDLFTLESFDILKRQISKGASGNYSEIALIELPEDAEPDLEYRYEDQSVNMGNIYEYLIIPRNNEGIEGVPDVILRVSFFGQGSLVETIPFESEQD